MKKGAVEGHCCDKLGEAAACDASVLYRHPSESWPLHLQSCAGESSRIWSKYLGDLDVVSDSWPTPDSCGHLGSEKMNESAF